MYTTSKIIFNTNYFLGFKAYGQKVFPVEPTQPILTATNITFSDPNHIGPLLNPNLTKYKSCDIHPNLVFIQHEMYCAVKRRGKMDTEIP